MIKWWRKRRERAQRSRFNSGYDYAVGSLIRGEKDERQLELQADNPFDADDFERGMLAGLRQLENKYIGRYDAPAIYRMHAALTARRYWAEEGARPGTFAPEPKPEYREDFLDQALAVGATMTGKPDGSESITIVFSIEAWRAFDLATRNVRLVTMPVGPNITVTEAGRRAADIPRHPRMPDPL